MGTHTIITERLILRKFELNDAIQMYNNWASNKKVTHFLTWAPHSNIASVEKSISKRLLKYSDPNFFDWGIELSVSKTLIGSITVTHYNKEENIMEIGYVIGEQWWSNGYTTEALTAVVTYLFENTVVKKIEGFHDPMNPQSGRVLKKSGFEYEGIVYKEFSDNLNCKKCQYSIYKNI
ncbi:ribosomal-protein-alanine N-acetyltransferase [Enterococcus sp. DIV2402]|uniref:Ribosomal-protein-alanine N-acetyltransferase n=1 Tax=Candidatus Enterococcus lowellii TaxID=2230877 RepID=A0ABZ2SJM2_9ENTE|nr:GNAT family N-acetyltransferase [Enterococcus sp. DIV2402]MBO0465535.1 GNAT family N-acetyltransferase [Enterococcus sp. DIV2402]